MKREWTQKEGVGEGREEFVGRSRYRREKIPEVEMEAPIHIRESKLGGQQTN